MSMLTAATMPAMNAYSIISLISCRESIMVPAIMNVMTAMNVMMHSMMLIALIIWRMCSIFGFIAHILLLLYEISRYDTYFKRRAHQGFEPWEAFTPQYLSRIPDSATLAIRHFINNFLVDENNDNT